MDRDAWKARWFMCAVCDEPIRQRTESERYDVGPRTCSVECMVEQMEHEEVDRDDD